MKKIKPDLLFEIWTPDEVAECLSGILAAGLYEKLWSLLEDYPDQRSPEEMESPDAMMSNNLAQFWKKFTREEQLKLNELAEASEAEDDARMAAL